MNNLREMVEFAATHESKRRHHIERSVMDIIAGYGVPVKRGIIMGELKLRDDLHIPLVSKMEVTSALIRLRQAGKLIGGSRTGDIRWSIPQPSC